MRFCWGFEGYFVSDSKMPLAVKVLVPSVENREAEVRNKQGDRRETQGERVKRIVTDLLIMFVL